CSVFKELSVATVIGATPLHNITACLPSQYVFSGNSPTVCTVTAFQRRIHIIPRLLCRVNMYIMDIRMLIERTRLA
ncbi:hypothetical protein, partial [Anaerosporomusa subterranea]|uniref:hypothetical protein n=1 Tax=Anaerosporomusa subterranea TaxID=1794912 RepID=UPI001E3E51B1